MHQRVGKMVCKARGLELQGRKQWYVLDNFGTSTQTKMRLNETDSYQLVSPADLWLLLESNYKPDLPVTTKGILSYEAITSNYSGNLEKSGENRWGEIRFHRHHRFPIFLPYLRGKNEIIAIGQKIKSESKIG